MISNLKELKNLLKLCREQGVTDIELGEVKLKFGDMPVKQSGHVNSDVEDPYEGFPEGILTPEQEIHLAMGGSVEDLPKVSSL